MSEPTVARDKERGARGVIDTLSAGYETVNRHPWVIAIPVLVDLFFWLGPHLSLAPLVQRTVGRVAAPIGLSAEMLQAYQEYRDELLRAGESFNLFSLLTTHFPGIPSLMSAREGLGQTATMEDPWMALLLSLLLPIAGIWLASAYYVAVGRQVRGNEERVSTLWSRVGRTWRRLLGFLLLAIGAALLFGVPLVILAVVAGAVSSSLLGFLVTFLWVTAMWVQFYLFFVVDAMVISDVGPIQAMRNSIAVVKSNLGPTLGLVVLVWLIMLGMPIVWDAMAQNPAGVVAGILGNAYISTGLAVASMSFYRDRFLRLAERSMGR
ncbi:MAG: DUF7847 domain-containing protein [Chloroflexota bacterium]